MLSWVMNATIALASGPAARGSIATAALALALALGGCGTSGPEAGDSAPAPADTTSSKESRPAGDLVLDAARRVADAPGAPEDAPDASDGGTYRTSLSICWTDATCKRVMAIAHGGAWDLASKPYDSDAAIAAAYAAGVEGVKIDVRVTKDGVPVIAHSSPIEIYESLDCFNKKIEDMTAAEVVQCHRFPSATEKFQRLDDVLGYLRGKMVTQLCVKLTADYAATIAELHAEKAEDFAFIELGSASDLQSIIPTISGSGTVWYLVNVGSDVTEVDTILSTIKNPRAFMVEFDPTVAVATIASTKLHPAGVRSFTYDSSVTASVQELAALFSGGYDVVSAQTAANAVKARIQINQARGISPP
jgi:hypothetical protein